MQVAPSNISEAKLENLDVITVKYLNDASIKALLKSYCNYLSVDKGLASDVCLKEMMKLMNTMIDRGDISLPLLDEVKKYIHISQSTAFNGIIDLTLSELDIADGVVTEESNSSIKSLYEYQQLQQLYKLKQQKLSAYFGTIIKQQQSTLLNSYNKLFDQPFIQQFKK